MIQQPEKLVNALATLLDSKPFEKISTLDLIRTAQISRTTFYRHFQDKFDFYDWAKSYLLNYFLEDNYDNETPKSFYTRYFQHFADYRSAFKSFIIEGRWQDFEQQIITSGITYYQKFLSRLPKNNVPIDVVAAYIVTAHIGVATNWLRTDDSRTPEELVEILIQLTSSVLSVYDIDFDTLFNHV
ncbi:TetR/AcrR family transcriptional regulator [Secundilactobacillus folii]|uniref:TetR family transcriptional regulator n=1 Tax=Secundilactobacillus folii TaxID=2678357 RepID=A0A7X2XW65_9LACO|nr:TetR/AcrR family transcriptional regulator [Secundilactobacillus folii]MTV82033.1 TetR family transcriptional regulator [Secundilactobacillus folii]